MKRSRIAILSVGVAAALIGIFSIFNFITPIAGKTGIIQGAGEEVPQMVLVSNDSTPQVPESADDFYPVIKERWSGATITTVTTDSEASSIAGFDVKFPTQMPSSDYKLQLAFVDAETGEDNKYVWLYYSKDPISDDLTINRFWEQGGILVIYHKNVTTSEDVNGDRSMSYSAIEGMADFAKQQGLSAYEPMINGHHGVAIGGQDRFFQGFQIHDPAQVDFASGNTYISLEAYMDKEELVKIAESIPM